MSTHRFEITYQSSDGERCRVIYQADASGLRWLRHEEVYEDGRWRCRGSEPITEPTVEIRPCGNRSFGGP